MLKRLHGRLSQPTQVRALTLVTAALTCILALTACGGLPTGDRISDGPAVRRALSEKLAMRLNLAPPVHLPVGIADQAFSYYGANEREMVLAVVFDGKNAVRVVLGTKRAGAPSRMTNVLRPAEQVVTYSSVVVFYTRIGRAPDRSSKILQAIRRAL